MVNSILPARLISKFNVGVLHYLFRTMSIFVFYPFIFMLQGLILLSMLRLTADNVQRINVISQNNVSITHSQIVFLFFLIFHFLLVFILQFYYFYFNDFISLMHSCDIFVVFTMFILEIFISLLYIYLMVFLY